jgi:hypothetical protein
VYNKPNGYSATGALDLGPDHHHHHQQQQQQQHPGPEVETGGNSEVLNVLLEKILIRDMKYRNPSTVNIAAICNISLCNLWRYECFRGTCLSMLSVGYFFLLWHKRPPHPSGPRPLHYRGFLITLRHNTLGRTPLDERSLRRTDLYLTTHNIHKRQTSMLPAGFEPIIPANERPQTHTLDRAATATGRVGY